MEKSASQSQLEGVEIIAPLQPGFADILTPQALTFVARMQREFDPSRTRLLSRRVEIQSEIDAGQLPDLPSATQRVRADETWRVAPTPDDLQQRWTEITGPTDRKMMINALNSGADVFMADFEDANSPTWSNMVDGQINLRDAVERTIKFSGPDGKEYALDEHTAVLMVRPRGWHLPEKHLLVDGQPVSAALFDFGLYFFHNAHKLIDTGTGPYFYLPKLENHLEARLWNEVFDFAQDEIGLPRGTIRATVLLETILAAFEMEEILYELRAHSAGLNAGRWDYIFSIIKKFHNQPGFLLPDRAQITMTTPFMRAYTELLVSTCHKRGAHAMGGMAAYIPSRKDPDVNAVALEKVQADKQREAGDGFDGTWVAHPDLVPVAREVFAQALADKRHQKDRLRADVRVSAADLMNFTVPGGQITEEGLRTNIRVGLLYLASWLQGVGAAAIENLMEDTATAEICRSQLWQWIQHPQAALPGGRKIDRQLFEQILAEELDRIQASFAEERLHSGGLRDARQIFDRIVTAEEFTDFLTLIGYEYLE